MRVAILRAGDRRQHVRRADDRPAPGWRRLLARLPDPAPARAALARWLEARSTRERRFGLGLAGVAATALYAGFVWRPIEAARAAAAHDIVRYERLAGRLRTAGPGLARLAAARRRAPSTVVADSAARAGLAIQRIEPQGAGVGVTLAAVRFDTLVGWLATLGRDAGMRVVALELERRPDPGLVDARIDLAA